MPFEHFTLHFKKRKKERNGIQLIDSDLINKISIFAHTIKQENKIKIIRLFSD